MVASKISSPFCQSYRVLIWTLRRIRGGREKAGEGECAGEMANERGEEDASSPPMG